MIAIDSVVGVVMVLAAGLAIWTPKLLSAVVLVGAVSLFAAYFFLRLGAPDVAMTEAAIGAGLTSFLFLAAIRRTEETES